MPLPPRPTFIPAPGVAQVEMIYSHLGVVMENVFHIVDSTAAPDPDAARLNAICDVFNNWETLNGRFLRSNQCRLALIRARQLGVQGGVVVEKAPVGNVTGSLTDPPCAGNVTVAVKWGTGLGGRSFRGRTYHIGIVNTFLAGNQMVTSGQTQYQSVYAGLITAVSATSGLHLAVLSFAHNNLWRPAGVATNILTASVDINIDSQRRRLTGRGT